MTDEIRDLELEAARIKLQREKIYLEQEIKKQNRAEKITEITKEAGNGAITIIEFILKLIGFSIVALIAGIIYWCIGFVIYLFFAFKEIPQGDFLWKVGYALAKAYPEITIPLSILVAVVVIIKGSKK